jgi:hypothetical protein
MCTPSEIVVLRFKLKESYENILDDGTRKEPSATKPQLFGAIWSLFRDLEAATSDDGRAPVVVRDKSGDDNPPHVDSEDLEDLSQSQSQSQSQSRLQSQSQSLPYSTYATHSATHSATPTQSQTQSQSQFHLQPHAQATPAMHAVENAKLARVALAKATRIAQEMTQVEAQEANRIKQDATADSKKAKKVERYKATMEKLGKLPPCPKLCRGEECSGTPCVEEGQGFSYEHMDDMVVCQDKAHMSMATTDGCLLFHVWPPRKRSPKPPAGPPAGHPARNLHPAKNGGGGTSGARPPPKNNGNPRAGKPRQAGKGTQQQQPRQQQQSVIAHQRAMERLNLQLEVARVNAGAKTVSYANVVKGTPPFSTPPPQLPHPTPPTPPPTTGAQQAPSTGKDEELATLLRGIMSWLCKSQL